VYAWLVGRLIRKGYAEVVAGRPRMLLRLADDDIRFSFPGHSSFAATLAGKAELSAWMERFASLHPDFRVHDVLVSGSPWNMRVAVRFSDTIGGDYSNEGAEYLRIRWGRLCSIEVFLDTERITEWESLHPELVAS
jgi:ketosteroid isomerase-like protein